MKTFTLTGFLASVAERKAALGVDESPQAVEALRNKGGARSPAKRAMLSRVKSRAKTAGVPTVPSY